MKLQRLKPRLSAIPTRLQQAPALHTERMRGSAAVKRRARWLEAHPLCCMCEAEGKIRAADVVDHVVPLWKDGADDYETNGQSLCNEHHDAKTAEEAKERAALGASAAR